MRRIDLDDRPRAQVSPAASELSPSLDWLATTGTNLAILGLGVVGGLLAARLLGPEGRGYLATAMVWALMTTAVGSLGLPQALTYHAAREPAAVGDILGTALMILAVQTPLVLLVAFSATGEILGGIPGALWPTRVYLLSVPGSLLITCLSTLAQGLARFRLANALRALAAASYPAGLVVAWLAGTTVSTVVVSLVSCQALAAVISMAVFRHAVRPRLSWQYRRAPALLGWALQTYWGSVAWHLNTRLDQWVMTAVVSMRDLGNYAVAVSYASLLLVLSSGFAMLLFPAIAADLTQRRRRITRALWMNVGVTIGAALLMILATPVLLPRLFGEAFVEAPAVAPVLVAATVLLGANHVLSDGLRGAGRMNFVSTAETIGLFVTIAALSVLLPPWGIAGAAWASVLSYGIVFLVLLRGLGAVSDQ